MMRISLIVDIKRHSLGDGPGIRSVVFFKGCLLGAVSTARIRSVRNTEVEITFSSKRVHRLWRMSDACPEKAINLDRPGRIQREKCVHYGASVEVCPGLGPEVHRQTLILLRR